MATPLRVVPYFPPCGCSKFEVPQKAPDGRKIRAPPRTQPGAWGGQRKWPIPLLEPLQTRGGCPAEGAQLGLQDRLGLWPEVRGGFLSDPLLPMSLQGPGAHWGGLGVH